MARCYSRDSKQNDPLEKKLGSSDADSDSDIDYVPHVVIRSGNKDENGAGSSKDADDINEEKKMSNIETSDSDSESDVEYEPHVISSNTKENGASTSKLLEVNSGSLNQIRPVLSLKCLHEDTDEESPSTQMDEDDSTSKFIDVNDVPELPLNDKDELQGNVGLDVKKGSEEHPNLEPVTKQAPTMILIPVGNFPPQMPIIPLRTSHEGIHHFKLKIDSSEGLKRIDNAVFSSSRNKLYVSRDVPFVVNVSADNVPEGSVIRVQAVFSRPEHACDSVIRCPTHVQQDLIKGYPAYEHFVQSMNEGAIYERNFKNSKMSVTVPYVKPPAAPKDPDVLPPPTPVENKHGPPSRPIRAVRTKSTSGARSGPSEEPSSPYLFKLTCFNSCVGGINRRPFTLVFALEKNKCLLGRQVMEAKVCACPTRDCKIEDKQESRRAKTAVEELKLWRQQQRQFVGIRPANIQPANIQPKPPGFIQPKPPGFILPKPAGSSQPKPAGSSQPKPAGSSQPKSAGSSQPKSAGSSQRLGRSQSSVPVKQVYKLTVQDQETFEFLQYMKILYEMNVDPILPDT